MVEIKPTLRVRDVMSSPVLTIKETDSSDKAGKLMEENKLGSLIVVSEAGKPIGIVTDRDLAIKVVGRNLKPSEVKVKSIMSSPLKAISPDADIVDAQSMMSRYRIRRLAVMEKGKLIGIISTTDISRALAHLLTILSEIERITEVAPIKAETLLSGNCEHCGCWSDMLRMLEGKYVCEECAADAKSAS